MKFFDNSINLSNKINKNSQSWTNNLLKTSEVEPTKVLEGIVDKVRENKEPDRIIQRQLDKDGYDLSRKNEKEYVTLEKSVNKGAKNVEVKYKEGTVETQLNNNDTRNSEYYEAGLSLFTKEVYPKIKKRMEKNKEFYNKKENKDRLSKEDVVSAKSKSVNVKISSSEESEFIELLNELEESIFTSLLEDKVSNVATHLGMVLDYAVNEDLMDMQTRDIYEDLVYKIENLRESNSIDKMECISRMKTLVQKIRQTMLNGYHKKRSSHEDLSNFTSLNSKNYKLDKKAGIGDSVKNIFRPTDTMPFINRARKIVDFLRNESEKYSFDRTKDYGLEAIGDTILEISETLRRDMSKMSFGKNRDELVAFVDTLNYLKNFLKRYSKGYSFSISKNLDSLRDFVEIAVMSLDKEIDVLRQRIHPIKESNLFTKIYVDKKNPRDCSDNEKAFCYKDLESRESKQKTPTEFKKKKD